MSVYYYSESDDYHPDGMIILWRHGCKINCRIKGGKLLRVRVCSPLSGYVKIRFYDSFDDAMDAVDKYAKRPSVIGPRIYRMLKRTFQRRGNSDGT